MFSLRSALALVVVVILAVLWSRHEAPRPPAVAAVAPAPKQDGGDDVASQARVQSGAAATMLEQLVAGDAPVVVGAPAPSDVLPLPPWNASLHEVLPALRARADAGDVAAQCHLGLALTACALVQAMAPSPAELRRLDPEAKDRVGELAQRGVDVWRAGRESTCAGLSRSELDLRFDYLQRAADAGVAAAMLAFVDGLALHTQPAVLEHEDWFLRHRQRTPTYVSALLRRGDRRIAHLLYVNADGQRGSLFAQAMNLDPVATATFWHLGRELQSAPEQPAKLVSGDADQRGRANALLLQARYFGAVLESGTTFAAQPDPLRVEDCRSKP
jgi:hypothetical protein